MQRYRDSGGTAKRTFNEPFIITQSDLHKEARGLIWDLRRHVDGHYVPVDYGARLVQRSVEARETHCLLWTALHIESDNVGTVRCLEQSLKQQLQKPSFTESNT